MSNYQKNLSFTFSVPHLNLPSHWMNALGFHGFLHSHYLQLHPRHLHTQCCQQLPDLSFPKTPIMNKSIKKLRAVLNQFFHFEGSDTDKINM